MIGSDIDIIILWVSMITFLWTGAAFVKRARDGKPGSAIAILCIWSICSFFIAALMLYKIN